MPSVPPEPIDLRGLQPPEPLLRILESIEAPGDGPHVFLLARAPLPLYPMLRQQGWRHAIRAGEHGFELTVFRNAIDP